MMVVPEEIIAVVFVAVDSASLRKVEKEEEEGKRGGGGRRHRRRESELRICDDGVRAPTTGSQFPTRKFVFGVSATCELHLPHR